MSVTVHLHRSLRHHVNGKESVEACGSTVGECLADIAEKHPGLKEALFDKGSRLKNTVEIYVNMESAYPDELKKTVKSGDSIHVLLLVAGG